MRVTKSSNQATSFFDVKKHEVFVLFDEFGWVLHLTLVDRILPVVNIPSGWHGADAEEQTIGRHVLPTDQLEKSRRDEEEKARKNTIVREKWFCGYRVSQERGKVTTCHLPGQRINALGYRLKNIID
jgi:hypothetical protein